jgi:hypothetical protein
MDATELPDPNGNDDREPRRRSADGRNQLSSIDLLPEAATGLIDQAIAELAVGRRMDIDILADFNKGLAEIGLGPISASAFGRYAMAKRKAVNALKMTRDVARAVSSELGPDSGDEVTRMLIEQLKTEIHKAIINGDTSPKQISDMSRSLASLMSAQRLSAEQAAKARAKREEADSAVVSTVDALKARHPEIDGDKILAAIRAAYGLES